MTRPVRLGSVGLGRWGEHLADAVVRIGAGEIVSCFTRTPATRARFAEKFGCRAAMSFEALLADDEVEGVLIATPHSTHVDMACAAAAAGKHVFVEKPLSLTVGEGERAIAATRQAGVVLQVANHRRRQAGIRRLREWIDAGDLGLVHLLEANFSTNISVHPKPGWKEELPERPLGGMTSLGLHVLDDFVFLAGPVHSLTVLSKPLLARGNLDDVTIVALELTSGPLAYLGTGMVFPKMELLAVHGSAGSAWNSAVIPPGEAVLQADRLYRQDLDELEPREVPNEPSDAIAEQMSEFAHCVRTGARPACGGEEALAAVRLLSACVESARTGQTILVEEFDARAREGSGA